MDRVNKVLKVLAKGQVSLHKLIASIGTENERKFAFVAVRPSEIDRQMAETDRRMRKTAKRIERLVIAIGKLIAARRQRLHCV